MHTITMPDKLSRTRITLPPLDASKVSRGHGPHRSGSGTHGDRRLKRLRSRGNERRAAMEEGSR